MPEEKIEGLTNDRPSTPGMLSPAGQRFDPVGAKRERSFGFALVALLLCFVVPLWKLAGFAAGSELFSYILLIPFISFYLVRQKRPVLPNTFEPARVLATGFMVAGTIVLLIYWIGMHPHLKLTGDDYLAVMVSAFLLYFFGVCGWFLGRQFLRANAFALGFLVFMVPIPSPAISEIDTFLQYGSAMVARVFFEMLGTPLIQDGLAFQLPGISLSIAPECSGIHSSMVLFIVSLLAGYFFLRRPWNRAIFILAVIPLSILRNGFRVFTIGELCVHIGPHMINSPIHRKGGPLFFALSLIPLFLLLIFLQGSERTGECFKTEPLKKSKPKPLE
jgi:exosortase C (VPDSG-CTERM-specific)